MVEQNCLTAPDAESDVDADLKLLDRQATGEIRVLENEIPKLQVLVEVVTGRISLTFNCWMRFGFQFQLCLQV